jgi:hypothetical protein
MNHLRAFRVSAFESVKTAMRLTHVGEIVIYNSPDWLDVGPPLLGLTRAQPRDRSTLHAIPERDRLEIRAHRANDAEGA